MANKKIKCYAYIRVSTSSQVDGFSLKAQEESIKRYAEYHDMEIIKIFSDEGKSGKNIEGRLAFQEMLYSIEHNIDDISFVLVFKLSRFGRNASDTLNSLQLMQDNNVNLISVEDGIDSSKESGKLMISVLSSVAEIERENILVQTMEGRKQKAREGKWNGGFAPFGYRLINGELIIKEDEAEIVKIIFDKYVHTIMGLDSIANYLNKMGYKKEKRVENHYELFSQHLIKSIIDNPIYMGKIAYGRRKSEKITGKRNQYHIVKQKEYDIYDGIHEAIIDEETWNLARIKREKSKDTYLKRHPLQHEHLLSGILKCPVCDANMYGNVSRRKNRQGVYHKEDYYYSCKHRKLIDGKKCNYNRQLREDELNKLVETFISQLINNPKLRESLNKKINTQIDVSELEKERECLEKSRTQLIGSKNRLGVKMDELDVNDRFYDEKYSDMENRLNSLYEKIDNVETEIQELEQCITDVKKNNISTEKIYLLLENFDKVYPKFSEKEKKLFLQSLIKRIDIYENKQENGLIIKRIQFKFPIFDTDNDRDSTDFWLDKENCVECVILLSHKNIDINIEVDEESHPFIQSKTPTYSQIKEYVYEHYNLKVSTLYISQIKHKCGIIERDNYNHPKNENPKQPKCPIEKENAIREAFKYFGMI